MTWNPNDPYRPEVRKCRHRLIKYCRGIGLDVGCGPEKIKQNAIGVDRGGAADLNCDLNQGLGILRDRCFDYVFSSHCLEDFKDTRGILAEWWRVLKVGGHMVLYLPHRDHYPNCGEPGANPAHQHDFIPGDIIEALDEFGASYEVVHHGVYDWKDEYSFDLVVKKLASDGMPQIKRPPALNGLKKALVIRYGAFGDHIIATSILPHLKADGYHITYNCVDRALPILANNPNIDEFWIQESNIIPKPELGEYWETAADGFDLVVNLSESIEGRWLFQPGTDEYQASDDHRRKLAGEVNYYRYACEVAGYPYVENPRGELYASEIERGFCELFREKYKDFFLILWGLSGSSMHKAYPFAEAVAMSLLSAYEDVVTITVGDEICRLLEWDHPRALKRSGGEGWDIRTSLLMCEHVDLVVAPETGLLNAAGCFNTPKIGMLTHSSKRNLTETFENDFSIQADYHCSPCHKMIYVDHDCPKWKPNLKLCACAAAFDPKEIIRKTEDIYRAWHIKRGTAPKVQSLLALPGMRRIETPAMVRAGRVAV